jgi:hypothetical protein
MRNHPANVKSAPRPFFNAQGSRRESEPTGACQCLVLVKGVS